MKLKQILPFIMALTFIQLSFAQNLNLKPTDRNRVWVELYAPVQTNGMRHFLNEDWLLFANNAHSRSYSSYATGIAYERVFENNMLIRPRIGISVRNVKEEGFSETINELGLDNNLETITATEIFEYKQKHLNLFLGVAQKVKLTKRLNIDIGVELAAISYLSADSQYDRRITVNNQEEPQYNSIEILNNKTTYGRAINMGIGPLFKPEYVLPNGLSFSVEAQLYFMRTKSDSENRSETFYSSTNAQESTNNQEASVTKFDLSQWSWSKVSPLFRIGYQF